MKKVVMILLLLITPLTLVYAKDNAQSLDQIVAVVNDDIITKTEFTHGIALAKEQIIQARITMPPNEILQKQVLDQLINKKLQMQVVKQAGIKITDEMVDAAIAHIAQKNQISVANLYQQLQQTGMSKTDYRAEIRDQMALQKIQQQEVMGRISVSPEEVTTFMKSKIWQANEDKEYNLEDILISLPDNPSAKEISVAKEHAENVLTKLRAGQSFQQAAQSDSEDSHALQGGNLGWRKLPEIPSVFADRVTNMKAKEIAGPIQAPNGFHLIRLAGIRAAQSKTPAPTKKQVEELLYQRKAEENAQVWVSRLRGQAFIVTNPTS